MNRLFTASSFTDSSRAALNRARAALNRVSLRVKLTVGYALIFSVCVLLGALGVYLAARNTLLQSLDTTLRQTASVAQASLEPGGGAGFAPELQPTRDLTIELLTASGTRLGLLGAEEHEPNLPLVPGLTTVADRRVLTVAISGDRLLRVSRPSDTLTEVNETLGRILLLGSLLMIGVACAAGYFLADRALRPVDEVARTAGRIARSGQYLERVTPAPGRDEMATLTETVNLMLDRLSVTIDREKEFARIAAHELRTPLTAIKGRLDLALERPRDNETYLKTLSVMQGRVNALVRLSEGLLELARSDAPLNLTAIELGAAALSAAESQRDAFLTAGKRLELDVEESWVQAELPGLQQLVHNLLENALKYGGPVVQVQVKSGTLAIRDSGRGPEQADWERLLRPFERGKALQSVAGSGLGLALVSALAARWGAEVAPSWSATGFTVRLSWNSG
ncbi:signal transduction histidine kinase [Deinococcus sp. UYEF24]